MGGEGKESAAHGGSIPGIGEVGGALWPTIRRRRDPVAGGRNGDDGGAMGARVLGGVDGGMQLVEAEE